MHTQANVLSIWYSGNQRGFAASFIYIKIEKLRKFQNPLIILSFILCTYTYVTWVRNEKNYGSRRKVNRTVERETATEERGIRIRNQIEKCNYTSRTTRIEPNFVLKRKKKNAFAIEEK